MKKPCLSTVASLVVSSAFWPGAANAQAVRSPRDIGGEVRNVFAAKCAACHGPDVAKPKGRFGYILDLRRIAANPELVIPLRPSESELWELVQHDEMPPADSAHGALTPLEKEIIRSWIAAGAPDASPAASEPSGSASESTPTPPLELTSADRAIRLLGKFHLLLLHFPIALVFAAGLGEAWSTWQGSPRPSGAVRFCLYLGALVAIPTACLGWLFAAAGNGVGSPGILTAHRWLGTAAAVWLVITAACIKEDDRSGVRTRRSQFLLAFAVLLTAIAAHLGGLLSRGQDFFRY
jgi:uncharacterized membrane protein/mono/diheme cytochrome c family protein